MGGKSSVPLPDLNGYMFVALCELEYVEIVYGGTPEIDAVRNAIKEFWPFGLDKERTKFKDTKKSKGDPRCYQFVLEVNPNGIVAREKSLAIQTRKMISKILTSLYSLGWELLLSTDISRTGDVSTFIFQRLEKAEATNLFTVGLIANDTVQVNDCPANIQAVIKEMCVSNWEPGIAVEQNTASTYEIKLKGDPWGYENPKQACNGRYLVKQIIQALSANHCSLYGNSNLKEGPDTLFFKSDGNAKEEDYLILSLNESDNLRFINVPDEIATAVEETIQKQWKSGVAGSADNRPVCYELKLNGNPWSCTDSEAVAPRILILQIMECLSSLGYFVKTALDVCLKKKEEKSLFLFEKCPPRNASFMCLSLHDFDILRLINAPQNAVEACKNVLTNWPKGVKERSPKNASYEAKLSGNPWQTMDTDGLYGRVLVLKLIDAFRTLKWRLMCSADISSMYSMNSPLDVHTLIFMLDN